MKAIMYLVNNIIPTILHIHTYTYLDTHTNTHRHSLLTQIRTHISLLGNAEVLNLTTSNCTFSHRRGVVDAAI